MTQIDATDISSPAEAPPMARLLSRARVFITLADQGLVSVASFATTFLMLHGVGGHGAVSENNFAYYTLAQNLMIWAAEFQATLVFTPHTIITPRLRAAALRRFHGSTLIHNFAISALTAIAAIVAAVLTAPHNHDMAIVLAALGAGLLVIGLRNYARPYAFAQRQPLAAFLLDLGVATLQIGGLAVLKYFGHLEAWTAIATIGVASAVPAFVWLATHWRHFAPNVRHSVEDIKNEWPNTRFVFFSGMVWNAGMQLYPWLIAVLAGEHEVAVWGACYTLAAVANPLMMGMQNFIGPRVAEAAAELPTREFARRVYRIAIFTAALMAGPAILLSIFAGKALHLLTHGQFDGQHLTISLLCAAIVTQALTFTLSRGLFVIDRADLDMYCNLLPLATLFTFGVWATHAYRVEGAAASMLIAQLFSATSRGVLFAYAISKKSPTTPPLTETRGYAAVGEAA